MNSVSCWSVLPLFLPSRREVRMSAGSGVVPEWVWRQYGEENGMCEGCGECEEGGSGQ